MFLSLLAQVTFVRGLEELTEDMGCFFLINLGIAGETAKAGRVLSGLQCCQCLKGANGMTLQKTVKACDFLIE